MIIWCPRLFYLIAFTNAMVEAQTSGGPHGRARRVPCAVNYGRAITMKKQGCYH